MYIYIYIYIYIFPRLPAFADARDDMRFLNRST